MLTGWRLVLSKFIIIPQRYVLSIMALLAIANAYTMRVCLNLAITQMVVRTNSEESLTALDETCPTPESATMYSSLNTSIYAPVKLMSSSDVKFEWSEATQGLLLSAFYYGYVLTHIPGGMFAERYGGKWVLGLGLLSTATCTFATPTVVKMWGAPGLFALRVIEGLGEGPTMPGMMAMVSKWAPANERARIGAIVFGGAQIGNIAGSIISGFIMHSGTWEDVFYVFGGGGLIWFALWLNIIKMTLSGWKLVLNKALIIPQRYVLGILGLFALANSFTMRVCLSMTITQMVVYTPQSEHIVGEICPDNPGLNTSSDSGNSSVVFEGRDKYDWDEATQGFLLSAFYYGYVLTHLPGGLLAEKFGGKWTLGLGLLVTSLATALTPLAVSIGGAVGLFIIRVIEGLGEGPVTPAFVLLLARWVPPSERSVFGAMIFGGAQIGNIFGPIISGILLADGGDWANVFYFFGGLGIIWFIFWVFLCYSTPNSHPFISDKEKEYLNSNVTASGLHKKLDPVPFKALLRSKPLWVLVLAAVGHDWGYFAMITDLPKYFSDVLKFNIKETGFMSALPYIAMYICSFIFAAFCDFCIKHKWHSITTGRKIYTTLSSTFPAILIILASYSGCNRLQAVSLFIASMAFMAGFYSSVKINAMDIAPNYAGTCSAFVNGLAAVAGIINPYLFGLLTPDQTVAQWRIAFWTVFAILIVTNAVYLIWGSGEQQWWDDVDKYGYPPGWKHGPLAKLPLASHIQRKVVQPKHDHSPVSYD